MHLPMRSRISGGLVALVAAFAGLSALAATASPDGGEEVRLRVALVPHACYAPGTSLDVVQRQEDELLRKQLRTRLVHSLVARAVGAGDVEKYRLGGRWTPANTGTDESIAGRAEPLTLTWSVVPDGTSIFGYNGEGTSPSDLRAFLDAIYGSEASWLPAFEQVFDRWGELTGIHYVYEPADDGSPWTETDIDGGEIGVRGDVRIAGHALDGNFGVLAYNFFPPYGDMVIDTSDEVFEDTSGNSLFLRNMLAHEHGHGLGLQHTCPLAGTKLMEPLISLGFDGPQHDDVLGAQRHYGDADEANDTAGTATDLGTPDGLLTRAERSLDSLADRDAFGFGVASGGSLDVTVTPVGFSYSEGPQNEDGSCSSGSAVDSSTAQDLEIRVLAPDGTEIASIDAAGAGSAESLGDVLLNQGPGTYVIEIRGDADEVQLYTLDLTVDGDGIFGDGFETGNTVRWTLQEPEI